MHSEYEDDVERITGDVTTYMNTVSQQSNGAISFQDAVQQRVEFGLWAACENANIRLVTDETDIIVDEPIDFRVALTFSARIDHDAITLAKAREILEGPVELFDVRVKIA